MSTLQVLTALDNWLRFTERSARLYDPGRALAGMLAVFAEFERDILQDRVKAGIAQARQEGKPHGRPKTAAKLVPEMKQLRKEGVSKPEIAKRLESAAPRLSGCYAPRSVRRLSGQPPQIPVCPSPDPNRKTLRNFSWAIPLSMRP